ncbi:cytochrome c oxidase subunit II [Motiliproteus sp. SC1-56]|uniref:cytochrome c oxidase subunit II n=1 Tax=Motiliproteus sp. SC1-56 TaxID=2799565 RepID=UPI001A8C03E9|nr:cytochrome c oxidase subunit II [Motiliproteus sp. SC1-56]
MKPVHGGLLFLAAGASPPLLAAWEVNLPIGVTAISRSVHDLHMLIFWVCVAIGVVLFGIMGWALVRHRKSKGFKPHKFHEHPGLEVLWTLIPAAILVFMAIPSAATLIEMYDRDEGDLTVRITGYQWKWRYTYLDEEIDFFSNLSTPQNQINNLTEKGDNYLLEVDRPLVIPAGKKVRFLLTANDVIHSWWVPALAVKKDAIPGFINEAWTRVDEPGIYRGQCTELCGRLHGFMPVVVEVKPEAEYQQWVAATRAEAEAAKSAAQAKDWTLAELMARGETVYQQSCSACHQAGGEGVPNVFPALKGSAVVTGPIAEHIEVVAFGKTNTAMQAFADQLGAVDLAAVITYERNAWGNDSGDRVTPAQINQALGKE